MGITMALVQNNYDDILKQSLFAQGDAFKQADLNSLYNQQELEQAKNLTLEGQFKNQQSQVMNPLHVEEQRQQNANLGYVGRGQQNANVISGNNAELSTANQGNALSKQAREAVISATDDEMKQLGQHIAKMYMNPETRADAVALEQLMPEMRKARAEQANKMEELKQQGSNRLAYSEQQGQNALDLNAVRRFAPQRGAGVSFSQHLTSQKNPERLSSIEGVLASGRNPDNQDQPLSPQDFTTLMAMRDSIVEANRVNAANRGTGADVVAHDARGKITLVPPTKEMYKSPTPGGGNKAGVTKSGTKFRVIETPTK